MYVIVIYAPSVQQLLHQQVCRHDPGILGLAGSSHTHEYESWHTCDGVRLSDSLNIGKYIRT